MFEQRPPGRENAFRRRAMRVWGGRKLRLDDTVRHSGKGHGGPRVGGIVLCGGQSRRMGRAKEWLPWEGRTLLQHVVDVVRAVAAPVVVAARKGQALPPLPEDVGVVHDEIEGVGPIAGVAAGFYALVGRCEAVLVTACDHPRIQPVVLRRLVENLGDRKGLVVRVAGVVNPLLGVYGIDAGAVVDALIGKGQYAMQRVVEACEAGVMDDIEFRDIDPTLESLRNVNDPVELDRLSSPRDRSEHAH